MNKREHILELAKTSMTPHEIANAVGSKVENVRTTISRLRKCGDLVCRPKFTRLKPLQSGKKYRSITIYIPEIKMPILVSALNKRPEMSLKQLCEKLILNIFTDDLISAVLDDSR